MLFYTRYGWEIICKHLQYVRMYLIFHRAYRRVLNGFASGEEDVAMDPVQASELDSLEIYHATPAAKIVVEKLKSKTAKRPSTVPGA